MSEYQYYEFLAIDQPLNDQQISELRSVSTRAAITSTSFVNEYHWGDFRGSPDRLMERHFDAFLYLANWGTRRIMLRLPSRLLDLETVQRYCVGGATSAWEADGSLIMSLWSEDDDGIGDWVDPQGQLASIVFIRSDLASGDLRALYLAWLLCVQTGEVDDDAEEPPVPAAMRDATAGMRALAEFLRIDDDLITVAATTAEQQHDDPAADHARWVAALPANEKDGFIVRLLQGDPHVLAELRRRFRESDARTAGSPRRRTARELLNAAEARRRADRDRQTAVACEGHLDSLAQDEEEAWQRVSRMIDAKKPHEYDAAVALLLDLRAVGERTGRSHVFDERARTLRSRHQRKTSLLTRLDNADL